MSYLKAHHPLWSSLFNTLPGSDTYNILGFKEKISGFNMIKPYLNLLKKELFDNRGNNKGALIRINELLIEYLSALEESDLTQFNYDLHIFFNIESEKTDILSLFGKHDLYNELVYSRDFIFITLTLKMLLQLFFELSEKLVLLTDANSYKSIISFERQYVESILNSNKSLPGKNFSKIRYFRSINLASETLLFHFSEFYKESAIDNKIRKIMEKIETRNNELNQLCSKIDAQLKRRK